MNRKRLNFAACDLGYYGEFCNLTCPPGLFGISCGGICLPTCALENCHHVHGCQDHTTTIKSTNQGNKMHLDEKTSENTHRQVTVKEMQTLYYVKQVLKN